MKEKIEKETTTSINYLTEQITSNIESTSGLHNSILILEKDVVWRIKECERLLSTRVTKDYVNQLN